MVFNFITKRSLPFCSTIHEEIRLFVDILESSHSGTQLFSDDSQVFIENLFIVFWPNWTVLPDTKNGSQILYIASFFHKMPKLINSIRYRKNQIIVRTHQLEKPASHWKTSNMYRNQPLKCGGNVLTFKWAKACSLYLTLHIKF